MRDAATGLLTLHAATAGLALARADAAADAHRLLRAPSLSAISFSFIALDPHLTFSRSRPGARPCAIMPGPTACPPVRDLLAALVQAETDKRLRAGRLRGGSGCRSGSTVIFLPAICRPPPSTSADARRRSSRRRDARSATFRPRRAATVTRAVLVLQRVERGAHHVVRVRRTDRLGDDVLHAERFRTRRASDRRR